MSLANAECVSESVREDGRLYTQITLTGALSGLSQDSFMQKGGDAPLVVGLGLGLGLG